MAAIADFPETVIHCYQLDGARTLDLQLSPQFSLLAVTGGTLAIAEACTTVCALDKLGL